MRASRFLQGWVRACRGLGAAGWGYVFGALALRSSLALRCAAPPFCGGLRHSLVRRGRRGVSPFRNMHLGAGVPRGWAWLLLRGWRGAGPGVSGILPLGRWLPALRLRAGGRVLRPLAAFAGCQVPEARLRAAGPSPLRFQRQAVRALTLKGPPGGGGRFYSSRCPPTPTLPAQIGS